MVNRTPTPREDGAPAPPEDGAPAPPEDGAPAPPEDGAPAPPEDGAPAPPEDGAPAPPEDGAPAPPEDGAPARPEDGAPARRHNRTSREMENGSPLEPTEMRESACRWTRFCDVMGSRQALFIKDLRQLKEQIRTAQKLDGFLMEIEIKKKCIKIPASRSLKHEETRRAIDSLRIRIDEITDSLTLNVPPEENKMLRECSADLVSLESHIAQVTTSTPESPREDGPSEPHGRQVPSSTSTFSEEEQHSLKVRINQNKKMLKKLQKFVDMKTERRWWLRDLFNFAQLIVKLLLFISASIAVYYPSQHVFSIITLALTMAQAVIEVLYQYFFKNKRAKNIKLQVIATKSAASAKA